jgi:SAM-dependent methyltransferase
MQDRYDDEVEYWRGVLGALKRGTASEQLKKQHQSLLDPETELERSIAEELPSGAEGQPWNVLDVGCGPLTVLGKRVGGRRLKITGVDPLADQYKAMLGEIGVKPPFESRKGFGEEVNRYFPHQHFDLVYSRNALDHSQQPHIAIKSMIQVAKPGAAIWVNVNRNEAINASYNGLHSWNFDTLFDTVVLWNPSESRTFEEITDGLPFKWSIKELHIDKTCPQEIDIIIYKDATDMSQMTEASPGIHAAVTGRGGFLSVWAPADLDERYNVFLHGISSTGKIVWNKSYRWYNKLRRRSYPFPKDLDIVQFRFGQFDVDFVDGKPIYNNLWVGTLPR